MSDELVQKGPDTGKNRASYVYRILGEDRQPCSVKRILVHLGKTGFNSNMHNHIKATVKGLAHCAVKKKLDAVNPTKKVINGEYVH